MPVVSPTIVGTSMGFGSRGRDRSDLDAGPIFDLCAELSGAVGTPKICCLGTAAGDRPSSLNSAYSVLSGRFRLSHLELFTMPNVVDVRAHMLDREVIWVGGLPHPNGVHYNSEDQRRPLYH